MNKVYIVEHISLSIVKKFDNKEEAEKSQKQLSLMFGVEFKLAEFTDIWQVNNRI